MGRAHLVPGLSNEITDYKSGGIADANGLNISGLPFGELLARTSALLRRSGDAIPPRQVNLPEPSKNLVRLRWGKEREIEDPDDVLIEAERRKRELAVEQQRREQESNESE